MIAKLLKHGTLFIIAKSTVLIAPLFAAYILDDASYGNVEWSISVAMIISTIITLASGNTIAFEKVKNPESPLILIGQKYSLYLAYFLMSLGLLSFLIDLDYKFTLIIGMCSFLVIQFALSAFMKADGLGAKASIVDSGLYIVLLIVLIFSWFQGIESLPNILFFTISALILSFFLKRTIKPLIKIEKTSQFKKFLFRGFPIMISGGIVIVFFNLPKILLGNESMIQLAEFSLLFRWAALALVVYQFIIVVYFRDIFSKTSEEFDKFIAIIGISIYIIGFAIFTFIYVSNKYQISFLPIPKVNSSVQFLLIGIVALWVISASLEGFIYREKKSIHQFWANFIGIAVFFALFISLKQQNNLLFITTLSWFIAFVTVIFYQLYIIQKYIIDKNFTFLNYLVLYISLMSVSLVIFLF